MHLRTYPLSLSVPSLGHTVLRLLLTRNPARSLHLKSPPAGSGNYVNLCTPSQTYFLRQVQSSNSIFLLRPTEWVEHRADGDGDGYGNGVEEVKYDAVTAVGLCKYTLELQGIKDVEGKVLEFMRGSVRVYDLADMEADAGGMDVDVDGATGSKEEKDRVLSRFFADTPFSPVECERAWTDICGFVHAAKGTSELVCWEATARVKLAVWKKIVEGALLEGIDLGKQFMTRDLWRTVDADGYGESGIAPFPRGLFDAVVRRLVEGSTGVYEDVKCEFLWDFFKVYVLIREILGTNFDGEKVISWVGQVYLEATAPTPASGISQSEYLAGWKDLLPERLREEASLDKVKVRFDGIPLK